MCPASISHRPLSSLLRFDFRSHPPSSIPSFFTSSSPRIEAYRTRLASLLFIIIVRSFSVRILRTSHRSLFFGNSGTQHLIAHPLQPLLRVCKVVPLEINTHTLPPWIACVVSICIDWRYLQATQQLGSLTFDSAHIALY
jgi:hypothetical protein